MHVTPWNYFRNSMQLSDEQMRGIFEENDTIAVVGASSKDYRPSNSVTKFLISKGYTIFPVNPNERRVLDITTYPDLKSIQEKIDIVQIFRKPDAVPDIIQDAIDIGAKVVWMQDGAGNEEAAKKAEAAGLLVIVDDCMLRQYIRLDEIKPIHREIS